MRRYGCQERLVARSRSERPKDRTPDRNETPGPSARNGGRLNGEFIIRTGGREGEDGGAAESIGDKLRLRTGGSVARARSLAGWKVRGAKGNEHLPSIQDPSSLPSPEMRSEGGVAP